MYNLNLYLSSMALRGQRVKEFCSNNQWSWVQNVELSAGPIEADIMKTLRHLKKNKIKFLLHNYFPVPIQPFVVNLCSVNDHIYSRSKNLIINAVKLSQLFGLKNYTFHSGFFIDPHPSDLGKIFNGKLINKDLGTKRFLDAVSEIRDIANKLNVSISIENNVLTKKMLAKFDKDVLMCTSIENTDILFSMLPRDVKLLVDLGHLKVSSNTLDFSIDKFMNKFCDRINALHLSDNDGHEDQNKVFAQTSWIYNYYDLKPDFISLEVIDTDKSAIEKCYYEVGECFQ